MTCRVAHWTMRYHCGIMSSFEDQLIEIPGSQTLLCQASSSFGLVFVSFHWGVAVDCNLRKTQNLKPKAIGGVRNSVLNVSHCFVLIRARRKKLPVVIVLAGEESYCEMAKKYDFGKDLGAKYAVSQVWKLTKQDYKYYIIGVGFTMLGVSDAYLRKCTMYTLKHVELESNHWEISQPHWIHIFLRGSKPDSKRFGQKVHRSNQVKRSHMRLDAF